MAENIDLTLAPESLEQALAHIEAYKKIVETKDKEIDELVEQVDAQNGVINELSDKVASLEVTVKEAKLPSTVEHEGVTYRVMSAASIGGVKYSPDEISENSDVITAILAIDGQGILIPTK